MVFSQGQLRRGCISSQSKLSQPPYGKGSVIRRTGVASYAVQLKSVLGVWNQATNEDRDKRGCPQQRGVIQKSWAAVEEADDVPDGLPWVRMVVAVPFDAVSKGDIKPAEPKLVMSSECRFQLLFGPVTPHREALRNGDTYDRGASDVLGTD